MFDIGFQELVLIGLIGLVVVGPARLPKLARTVGLYVNKMRRFVTDVRTDVERELHAEELRQSLSGNGEFDELKNVVKEARAGLDDVRASVGETRDELTAATSTPTDWSNPDAVPDNTLPDSGGPDNAGLDNEVSAPTADTTPPDGTEQADKSVAASSASALEASLAENVTTTDEVGSQTAAHNTPDEPDDDVTTLNPRSQDEFTAQHGSAPAAPEAKTTSGAASDGSVSRLNAPEPASVDHDEEEPTVFNSALASKREAGSKPD